LEEGMGLRTLFDSGSGGAASEHAQRALRASARLTGEPPIGRRIHPGISVINNGTEWVHFFLEEGMGVRTLFDSGSGVAASEHAQRALRASARLTGEPPTGRRIHPALSARRKWAHLGPFFVKRAWDFEPCSTHAAA